MKRKTLAGNLQYKCRRCGAICFSEKVGESKNVLAFDKSSQHLCNDGGIGILDFVGLSPLQEILAITTRHRVSRMGPETYLSTRYIKPNAEEKPIK